MRRSHIKAVFLKELRETLRDRRSMIVMFGIPLVLYPLIFLGVAGLGMSRQKQISEHVDLVAVINPSAAPELFHRLEISKHMRLYTPSGDAREALADRRIDGVLILPDSAQQDALASRPVTMTVLVDRSRTEAAVIERRLNALLDDYERWILEQRVNGEIDAQLDAHGVPRENATEPSTQSSIKRIFSPIDRDVQDIASGRQRFGKLLSMLLPNILLLTGMLGAFFPAINATTTERENGTLETLLVSPVSRTELLLAKGSLVLITSLATAGLNLVSMSLVLWRTFSVMDTPALHDLQIPPLALLLTFVAVVPSLIFFSALVLSVGLFARNFREANSYATPVMLIPLISVAVSIAEPQVTAGLLVTPVVSTTLIIREVLTGHAQAGAFILSFISSCCYAGLMVSAASRLFTNEQLVNPAWEPFSIGGLRRGLTRMRPRLPAIDEAIALFAVTVLLLFYISPEFKKHGLLAAVYGNQLLLFVAPTALFALAGRWRIRETFSLNRVAPLTLVAAAMLGIGLTPIATALSRLQSHFWPADPAQSEALAELFVLALRYHPVLTISSVAILAGVCEELLYRGAILCAVRKSAKPLTAAVIAAALFAIAHLNLHGLPIRFALGTILGLLLLRTGSIYPAMIAHGCYDAAQLFMIWQYLKADHWRTKSDPTESLAILQKTDALLIPAGVLLVVGAVLIILRSRRADAPLVNSNASALQVAVAK